jgi:signal transduction histidine kinase
MSSQSPQPLAARLEGVPGLANSAAYITLVIGYLLGILLARHLTVGNFLAFSAAHLLYVATLWLLIRYEQTSRPVVLALLMLALFVWTVLSGLLAFTGLYWDWLLYLVTTALYFTTLRIRPALLLTLFLYGVQALNLAWLNQWNWSANTLSNLATLVPAFAFVAAFSLIMVLHRQQKERAEQLLQEVEQSKRDLEAAHAQLSQYAEQVEELSIARERTRIAREMHDTLGHYLTILNVQLETVSKLQERDPARAAAEIAEARHVAAQSMQELRNAITALRLTGSTVASLPEALTQLAREFQRAAGETELTLDLETELPPLSPELQVMLYRAAQEALTNVRKHAQASKVLMRLRYEDEWLELLVLDNGAGLAPADTMVHEDNKPPASGGFGLIGLRERAELLGGKVSAGPASPSGFRITVRARVPAAPAAAPGVQPELAQKEAV